MKKHQKVINYKLSYKISNKYNINYIYYINKDNNLRIVHVKKGQKMPKLLAFPVLDSEISELTFTKKHKKECSTKHNVKVLDYKDGIIICHNANDLAPLKHAEVNYYIPFLLFYPSQNKICHNFKIIEPVICNYLIQTEYYAPNSRIKFSTMVDFALKQLIGATKATQTNKYSSKYKRGLRSSNSRSSTSAHRGGVERGERRYNKRHNKKYLTNKK